MRLKRVVCGLMVFVMLGAVQVFAQLKGAESIKADELRQHLMFIASYGMRGRLNPSPELDMAAQYLASMSQYFGLKPILPNGSYLQTFEGTTRKLDERLTKMTVKSSPLSVVEFSFPEAFSVTGQTPGVYSGTVVFLPAIPATEEAWNSTAKNIDFAGKMVITLQSQAQGQAGVTGQRGGVGGVTGAPGVARFRAADSIRIKGAAGVLTIISSQREQDMVARGEYFSNTASTSFPRSTPPASITVQLPPAQPTAGQPQPPAGRAQPFTGQVQPTIRLPFFQGEIRHEVAAAILGIPKADLFNESVTSPLSGKIFPDVRVTVTVEVRTTKTTTQNVVAMIEGSDPVLKNEYVCYGCHYDHLGVRGDAVYFGADDNGSGTVSLLEIAKAFMTERPKRSIIIVWHTGEEEGMIGSGYFTANPPIPLEKVSAEINIDMIGRNAPDTLFVIGADRISTELDQSIKDMNNKYTKMGLNYRYNALDDRNRYYSRSDHYMYAQRGIPVVFFFGDVHPDYHRPTDTIDKINFAKMERVARLAFFVGWDVSNKKDLLKLDANPNITVRGKYYVESRRE